MDKTDEYSQGIKDGKEACLSELKERVEAMQEGGLTDTNMISREGVLNLIEQMQER